MIRDSAVTNIIPPASHPVMRVSEYRSLTGCLWRLREADDRAALAIMQRYGLPDVLARMLSVRGVDADSVDSFLNPSLKTAMPDPSHLLDMDIAAKRLAAAIMTGEKIAIFGDYDVDGATSAALLTRYLRALGADPMITIPDRMKEGYGPNAAAMLTLKERGASVVITVDCGTLAFAPLEAAHQAGLDVIVIDHHQGEARKPKCLALVNPNRLDETSPHRQLAAVGVAFLLCVATNRLLRTGGWFEKHPEPDLRQWLDIVALGTVCDMVPMTGVNRALVTQGLKVMAARENLGMRTLMDTARVDEKPGTYTCGFVLGPRINAGGRVGKSDLGVRLLTTDDATEALMLAKELEQHNEERRAIETTVLEEAMAKAEQAHETCSMLVIAGKSWHLGVIGIVASRLKEKFNMPSAVIALGGGIGKASARSVTGFDMGAAVIAACAEGLLVQGGGHAMAAGFTVEEGKIPALAEFFEARIRAAHVPITKQKNVSLDGIISIAGATLELADTIERMGPFGSGNPSIRLVVEQVVNLKPEIVKEQHVRTLFIDPLSNARLSGIAFRVVGTKLGAELLKTRGQKLHVAGQLRAQEWNGKKTVSFMIDDIASA